MAKRRGRPVAALLIVLGTLVVAAIGAVGLWYADMAAAFRGEALSVIWVTVLALVGVGGLVFAVLVGFGLVLGRKRVAMPALGYGPSVAVAPSPPAHPAPSAASVPCPGCGRTVSGQVGRCPYCQTIVEGGGDG